MYDFNLADVAEVWRRGSVVAFRWLLDLTAISLARSAGSGEIPQGAFRIPAKAAGRAAGRHRRRIRARTRAQRRFVPALHLARRSRLRGQVAIGDALSVRRTP